MGSKGDAYDNAVAESFFASLEKDLLRRQSFPTRQDARTAVFDYIETFYNPIRLHSTLGYLSPIEYEKTTNEEGRASSLVTTCPQNRGGPRQLTSEAPATPYGLADPLRVIAGRV